MKEKFLKIYYNREFIETEITEILSESNLLELIIGITKHVRKRSSS